MSSTLVKHEKIEDVSNQFNRVPNELMVKILTKLDSSSVNKVSTVCTRFRNLISNYNDKMQKREFYRVMVRPFCPTRDWPSIGHHTITLFSATEPYSVIIYILKSEKSNGDVEFEVYHSSFPDFVMRRVKISVSDPAIALLEILGDILKNSTVVELEFYLVDFKPQFVDMREERRTFSVDSLVFNICSLSMTCEAFGTFMSQLGPTSIEMDCVTVCKQMLGSDDTNDYFKKFIQANPQLTGISLKKSCECSDVGYEPLYVYSMDYGQILPTHIYSGMVTNIERIVGAVREWLMGKRELLSVRTHLDNRTTTKEVCEIFGAKNLTPDRGHALIENVNGQRLRFICRSTVDYDYFSMRQCLDRV